MLYSAICNAEARRAELELEYWRDVQLYPSWLV